MMRDGSCAVIAWFDAYFGWRSSRLGIWGNPAIPLHLPCIGMEKNNRQRDKGKEE
jgi:hypothetical protein